MSTPSCSWIARLTAPLVLVGLACLVGCSQPEEVPAPAGCGDGVVQLGEECDDGDFNSDEASGACRLSCLNPTCGDGVIDTGESCDDGNPWGGDGCSPSCLPEAGQLELEPNDRFDGATLLTGGLPVTGSAPAGDVDCYRIEVPEAGWLSLDVQSEGEQCPAPMQLRLSDPAGNLMALGTPDGQEGCSPITPEADEGARFMAAGFWTVCLQGVLLEDVPAYTLYWTVGDDSCELTEVPILPADDLDDDGLIARCDLDDDGDGIADGADNCPDDPNGPDPIEATTLDEGFIRYWLQAGPFTEGESDADCRPSELELLGDDAAAAPLLGEPVGDLHWTALISNQHRLRFGHLNYVEAPREVYIVTWLFSQQGRAATLALGPDDGARAWLNGVEVAEIDSCQGTTVDEFTFDTELVAGWNRLLLKVHDHGGAWGTYVRFLDVLSGEPIRTFELSLSADGPWIDNQGDLDDDGIGNVCDDAPVTPDG